MIKKKLFMVMMVFCLIFTFAAQSNQIFPITYAYAKESSQGVDSLWNGMSMSKDGVLNPGDAFESADDDVEIRNNILGKYKTLLLFATGILTITAFAGMIFNISKLSISGSNDAARQKAIMGILFSGIGIALMGSATIIIGVFYNAFRE